MSAADRPDTQGMALSVFDDLIAASGRLASALGARRVTPAHLLQAFLADPLSFQVVADRGIDPIDVRRRLHTELGLAGAWHGRAGQDDMGDPPAIDGVLLDDIAEARRSLQSDLTSPMIGLADTVPGENDLWAGSDAHLAPLHALFGVIERHLESDPICRSAFGSAGEDPPEKPGVPGGSELVSLSDIMNLESRRRVNPEAEPHPQVQEDLDAEIDDLIMSLRRGREEGDLQGQGDARRPKIHQGPEDYAPGSASPDPGQDVHAFRNGHGEADRREPARPGNSHRFQAIPGGAVPGASAPPAGRGPTPGPEAPRLPPFDTQGDGEPAHGDPAAMFRRTSGPASPDARQQGDAASHGKGGRTGPQSSTLARDLEEVKAAVAKAFRSLTDAAAEGRLDPVIGRDREIDHVLAALQRRRKRSVILHGPSGVGKTAIAEGVAMALRGPDAPRTLANRQVLELSMSSLISGARYRGDFEERITLAINRIVEEGAIIFIDEIHTIMGLGGSSVKSMDAPNILKPVLARGDVLLIGATTTEELAVIQRDKAVARRFEMIEIREPGLEDMRRILERSSHAYLDHHGLLWADGVDAEILEICHRWVPEARFPDKALDLLDRSCVEALRSFSDRVEIDHVRQAATRAGIPLPAPAGPSERRRLERIRTSLRTSGVTEDGLDALATSLRLQALAPSARAGAQAWLVTGSPESRSAMVKALAESLGRRPVSLSAARLASPGAADWLIGNPRLAGDSGVLIEMLETAPGDIAVLDGIEGAHPDIIEMLEKMVSEPEIRTGSGRTIATRRLSMILSCALPPDVSIGFLARQEASAGPVLPKSLRSLHGRSGVCILDADRSIRPASMISEALADILSYLRLSGYAVDLADGLADRIEALRGEGKAPPDLGPAGREAILAQCLETLSGVSSGRPWILDLEVGTQGPGLSVRK